MAITSLLALRSTSSSPDGRQFLGVGGQRDRKREEHPVAKPHIVQHPLIIGFAHEAVQRRKPAGGEQFKVAQVAHGDLDGRQLRGAPEKFIPFFAGHHQVDQFITAIRGDQFSFRHYYSIKRLDYQGFGKCKRVLYFKIQSVNFRIKPAIIFLSSSVVENQKDG